MPSILGKYDILSELCEFSNIKTYLTQSILIVKEIIPKNKDDYLIIRENLEVLKYQYNIYEIKEQNEKIYIVIDNNEELNSIIDKLIFSEDIEIKKEAIIQGHGYPILKEEINKLFQLENAMCKITSSVVENSSLKEVKASGFFCEMEDNFPFKYALFTCNHALNDKNIENGKTISFKYNNEDKHLSITDKRKTYTNDNLDYTCIQIFESDGIKGFFKIEPNLRSNNNNEILKNIDIFVLQYPKGNLSFSCGKVLSSIGKNIRHTASTDEGSSGSPIIRRCEDNFIIGLHNGGLTNKKVIYENNRKLEYNLALNLHSIIEDIKKKEIIGINKNIPNKNNILPLEKNEINCIYLPDNKNKVIILLHDYKESLDDFDEDSKRLYLETKELNQKLFEENVELYVNNKKVKFDYKYRINNNSKEIKVKFKFKTLLDNISFMFYKCECLKSIDFSSFNSSNINKMVSMFYYCTSLESINFTVFNTRKVTDMNNLFFNCFKLTSLNLKSFDTRNVTNMRSKFSNCSSLQSLDLSSFKLDKLQI